SWPAARAGLMNQVVRKDSQKALAHTPSAKSMTADTASTTVSATIIRSFLLHARRLGQHVARTPPRTTPAHGVQYSCSHNLLQVSDFRRFGARRGSPEVELREGFQSVRTTLRVSVRRPWWSRA